jgi:phytoene synthase
MTPIHYCYEKIAKHGTPLYYCSKKISADKRDGVVACAAFYQELLDIILNGTDISVSANQFNWWRDEVVKLMQGSPTHPVTMAMQETKVNLHRLLDLIDGLAQNLNLPVFDSFETVVIHIMRTVGVRELMFADALELDVTKEILFQFAIVLELINYIQYLRPYVRCGLIFFPQDEMNQFNVSLSALHQFKTTPEIVNLLKYQVDKVERAYQGASEQLTPGVKKQLSYMISRCEIARATLHEIQNSRFSVLEHFIQLTPLRMWWIAYRSE